MRFPEILGRVSTMRGPDGLAEEWLSPYRLLWGAGYSIGQAEQSAALAIPAEVPWDLFSSLGPAVQGGAELPWFHSWKGSYLLTNAIFRVAAAAEKTCSLSAGQVEWRRDDLWKAVKKPGSALSKKLPKAYQLLRHMPAGLRARATYLHRQRNVLFRIRRKIVRPLICAFIQTDTDKHVPYRPLKELAFDFTLATNSFLEACALWDAAVNAERR